MNRSRIVRGTTRALAVLGVTSVASAAPVKHTVDTVNGSRVDRYSWHDSKGLERSVSLKREGEGNPGHGGYAVQMTYEIRVKGGRRTIRVDAAPGEDGFGYFVSHERYRDFTDGANDTIAHHVFGRDDSPLGRNFKVVGKRLATNKPELAAHRFKLTYPRYGTVNPIRKNDEGSDSRRTPVEPAKLELYDLPVTIIWTFQDGTDYPRIQTEVSLDRVPGPDRVDFDVRGPYGVLDFDGGRGLVIDKVMWGDRFHFTSLGKPLTRNSDWRWNQRNNGARYSALIAGRYEMGLLEPRPWRDSALAHGFAFNRGETSDDQPGRRGCPEQDQRLPCDWEWPYQSAQYSLPYGNTNAPTDYKKMAWGSVPNYGSGPSLQVVWDSETTKTKFNGFPNSGAIRYSVCVVLGLTEGGGLTRTVAAGPNYHCAGAL